ncbi:MAG: HAMP domain-containing sensor histidine kinase [Pseudomonadota bacterium]
MSVNFSLLWRGKTGRLFLYIFIIAVIIHLVVLGIFAQINKTRQFHLNYYFMVQQIADTFSTLQQTDTKNLEPTIKTIAIPGLDLDIDNKPDYKLIVNLETPIWIVQKYMTTETPQNKINLSVYLPNQRWLNISATVVKTPWRFEIMLLSIELIALAAIFISIWSINRFTEPLKKFRLAAEELGVNLDRKPLAVYGPSVVQDTAQALNQMQKRIQDLLRHRTQMLIALSHDLRTPITRLKLRLHLIDDENIQEKFNNDLDQIEAMIDETLSYVREKSRQETKIKIDLCALLQSICDDYTDTGKKVNFTTSVQKAYISGQALALKRAFSNIIDNAIKYAGSATIRLEQHSDDSHYQISIEDQGPGIDQQLKEKVFEPFYRIEDSRSRSTGGTGLGLAIVEDIIKSHQGKIKLEDNQPQGLRVVIELK